MKSTLAVLLLLGVPVFSGCTAGSIYDDLRDSERDKCARMPESQAKQCYERTADSYDEYRRKVEQHRSAGKQKDNKKDKKTESSSNPWVPAP